MKSLFCVLWSEIQETDDMEEQNCVYILTVKQSVVNGAVYTSDITVEIVCNTTPLHYIPK